MEAIDEKITALQERKIALELDIDLQKAELKSINAQLQLLKEAKERK